MFTQKKTLACEALDGSIGSLDHSKFRNLSRLIDEVVVITGRHSHELCVSRHIFTACMSPLIYDHSNKHSRWHVWLGVQPVHLKNVRG